MSVGDLFELPATQGRVEQIVDTALFEANIFKECQTYSEALRRAVEKEPPPFGTKGYADVFRDASADVLWMSVSLITNAEREGDGAKRLWSLAACSPSEHEQALLKIHAVDESRHSLIYLALLDLAFPGRTAPDFRLELQQLSPHYSMRMKLSAVEGSPYAKPPEVDDYIQINIAEVRTTIHHVMQRTALFSHVSLETQTRMRPMLDCLLRDELKHVAYTAKLIEQYAGSLSRQTLLSLFQSRLRDFNEITKEELGERWFDCSIACCAKRPHCRAKARALL